MTYLLDTNVLLRWAQHQLPEHPMAVAAVAALNARGDRVCFTPQNLIEFWAVATRPAGANGLGLEPRVVDQILSRVEQVFGVVSDIPDIYPEWRVLVAITASRGRQVYDARLAAVMKAHGIDHILTFNTADFARYPGLVAVHPRDAAGVP